MQDLSLTPSASGAGAGVARGAAQTPTAAQPCLPFKGLKEALDQLLRPAVGFRDPLDVLKDPDLDVAEKRAVLSSWASDACAVEDHPTLRWLVGTEAPVPLRDIQLALARLDRLEGRLN